MYAMKKIVFISLAALLTVVSASCVKEISGVNKEIENDGLVNVTIIAGNPEASSATKTEMVGTTPYWSKGDAIGVSDCNQENNPTNNKFTTDISDPSTTASFTGTTSVSSTLYAYYPYTSNGVSKYGAKVDIPVLQKPTATSFDGKADIMISKQFSVSPANTTVSGLEFARLGAIVKIIFLDQTSTLSSEHPHYVSLSSSDADLVGRAYLDMINQDIGTLYSNKSKIVTAEYTSDTMYSIDGENATYLIVYPQTVTEGTLTFKATTENYAISKTVALPSGGIHFAAGKITTLKVKVNAENIGSNALDLPYSNELINSHDKFFIENISKGGRGDVWYDNSYGMTANGQSCTSDVESYLYSPVFDLTGVSNATLFFDHGVNFFASIAKAQEETALQIKVGAGSWTDLAIPYPAELGNGYTSVALNLDTYVGETIQLRFKFTATTTKPGRWQIKNFVLRELVHGVSAEPNPVVVGGSKDDTAVLTATSDYDITYQITDGASKFSVTQDGYVFTIKALADGGAAEATIGTLRIKESASSSYYYDVTVKQSAKPSGSLPDLEEIEFSKLDLENGVQYPDPFDGGNFTITFAGGANDGKYYTTGTGIRTYGDGTITIASDYNIVKIEFKWSGSSYAPSAGSVASVGTYTTATHTWTGSADSIVLTRPSGSGHWRLQKVTVYYK